MGRGVRGSLDIEGEVLIMAPTTRGRPETLLETLHQK